MSFKPFSVLNTFISTNDHAFKNLSAEAICEHLEAIPFQRIPTIITANNGWVPPHSDMQVLGAVSEGHLLMTLKTETKKINTSELKELCELEYAKYKKENNLEKLPSEIRNNITSKIQSELSKTAQSTFKTTMGWLSIPDKRLILNTSNMKQAEAFINFLEATIHQNDKDFNGFGFCPLQIATDIPLKMTTWVEDTTTMPENLHLKTECVIREPQQENHKQGKISYSAQELEGDRNLEIYLGEFNYSVVSLALEYRDEEEEIEASMNIDESFMIKKFKLGYCYKALLKESEYDTELERFDLEFNAFTKISNLILNNVIECFGGSLKDEEAQ